MEESGSVQKANAAVQNKIQHDMADARRTLEACAEFTRAGCPTAPDHDATNAARIARVKAEESRLIQWAKANGCVNRRIPPIWTKGGEHQVYFFERLKRYKKATLPTKHRGYGIALGSYTHGATPSEYLDRLSLQNLIFGDDIRLEGIVISEEKPIIVTSQTAMEGSQAPLEAIDALMNEKGYERLDEGAYYDEDAGLLIFDLAPRNAIITSAKTVFPIDPVIQRITPEFGEFLRANPHTINLPH